MVAICANTCNVMLSGVSQNQKEEKDEKLVQFVICSGSQVLVFHCILSPASVLLFTGNKSCVVPFAAHLDGRQAAANGARETIGPRQSPRSSGGEKRTRAASAPISA